MGTTLQLNFPGSEKITLAGSADKQTAARLRSFKKELKGNYFNLLKYSCDPLGSGFIVAAPFVQPAGHTSPCLAVYW